MRPCALQLAGLVHSTVMQVQPPEGHSFTVYDAQGPPVGGVMVIAAVVGLVGLGTSEGTLQREDIQSLPFTEGSAPIELDAMVQNAALLRATACVTSPPTLDLASSSTAYLMQALCCHSEGCPPR